MLAVLVRCDGGSVRAVWFNMPFMAKEFSTGMRVVIAGVPRKSGGIWETAHPDVRFLDPGEDGCAPAQWLAVYPLTAGVQQSHVRVAVQAALDHVVDGLKEAFAEDFRRAAGLVTIQEAFRGLHRPMSRAGHRCGPPAAGLRRPPDRAAHAA